MSIAPLPTPLQNLGGRRFSFYPPIRNLGPNEWLYRRATWSECVVMNAESGEEVWIPRMFLGDVTRTNDALMLVRLNRELEWKDGAIIPLRRNVIELPVAVNDRSPHSSTGHSAAVISIRLEAKPEVRARKWIGAVVLGAVACTVITNVVWQAQSHQRLDVYRGYRPWLQLVADDDLAAVTRKLGSPAVVTIDSSGDRVFRSLAWKGRRFCVVLMGSNPENVRYIGTLDNHGHVLDAVRLRDGASSEPILNPALNPVLNGGLLRSLHAF